MQVSEMQVRDIMIPRSQMDVIDITDTPEIFIPFVIKGRALALSRHCRKQKMT